MKKIIVVVDMQNDFITGPLGTPEAQALVPRLAEYLNNISENDYVFFTKDTHYPNYLDTFEGKKLPVPHCLAETNGWEIPGILTLSFLNSPVTICKHTFGSLDLINYIKDVIEPDDVIEICGVCTDICVITNALLCRTYFRNNEITVYENLCAGTTPTSHQDALSVMNKCHINIVYDN